MSFIDRALGRFRSCPPTEPANDAATLSLRADDDIFLALGTREFEQLGRALGEATGSKIKPDTPDLLTTALAAAITRRAGRGVPHVWRSPAGLHTPESWQIRIDGVDDGTRLAIGHAIRGGGFA
jgi:hypothetical protein